MEAYTDFAQVYDELMDETPYEEWCEFLVEIFRKYGVEELLKNDKGDINDKNVTNNSWENTADSRAAAEAFSDKEGAVPEQTAVNLCQERNTVLDLGCGTGTLTELLARRGYDMIGLDNAPGMLQIAVEKRESSGLPILYLMQDMREFELYGTVGAVVSVCDSLNYLLLEEDVVETFCRVNNYLYPRGIFVFDFNTVYKYAEVIGDATIAENREDCSFIWENYYHEEQEINEYDLTVFVAGGRSVATADAAKLDKADANTVKQGQNDEDLMQESSRVTEQGMWFRRFQEVHYQRGYRLEQMKAFLKRAGLDFIEALDADTHGKVTARSERIYVVARKGAGTAANQKVER